MGQRGNGSTGQGGASGKPHYLVTPFTRYPVIPFTRYPITPLPCHPANPL